MISERTGETESSYEQQEQDISRSLISLASHVVEFQKNTRLTNEFLREHQTAALHHLKRIADYLELGPGVWYQVDGVGITFFDSEEEPNVRSEGPAKTSFRWLWNK